MDEHEDACLGAQENEDRAMNENDDETDNEEDDKKPLSPEMNFALTELASRLCSVCQNLCRGEVKVTREVEHHLSLSSLRESVDAGCPLCKEIAQSFEKRLEMKPEVRESVDDSWYIACWQCVTGWRYADDGLCFEFTFYDNNRQPANRKLGANTSMMFFPAETLGLGPEYLEYAARAPNATFTPDIDLAKRWFDTCLDDHNCRDEGRPKFLPTRLIEVRTHGGTSDTVARLCDAEDFSPDASYLTLSHCWGNNTILTLTKENLEILKRDIPIHQLPALFKDALHITTELGMKYIWIDCLCILQDCQDDWTYEAARMGDIYRSAKCNIAASGYKDGKTRLLEERTPLPLLHFPLHLDRVLVDDEETAGHDERTPFKGIYVRGHPREFYHEITGGPLNSRGWVAQERALSPAILHFTPKQMWWECRRHVASEAFPDIDLVWDWAGGSDVHGPNGLRSLSAESDAREVYLSWNYFVSFYSETDLTVESDRFPALHGIARAFGELTGDNLIAGFWEGDLIQSLAWWVPDRAKRIPCTQRAPTWSWAFLCVPHSTAYIFVEDLPTLCTCRRVLSDDPCFMSDLHSTSFQKSAVRGLEITGLLRKLPIKVERLSELAEWTDYVEKIIVHYDVAESSFFSAEDVSNTEQAWHWEEPRHILPLIKQSLGGVHVSCLLLNQDLGAEHSNTFRRLGVVNIYFKDDDSCDEVLDIGEGNGKSKLSTVFEDCGQHDLILI